LLRPKTPQTSFLGNWIYDRIVPSDHLLRKINLFVDFSFVTDLVKDRYTPDFGRLVKDPEFMLQIVQRHCLSFRELIIPNSLTCLHGNHV
jgi:hypothetical protein